LSGDEHETRGEDEDSVRIVALSPDDVAALQELSATCPLLPVTETPAGYTPLAASSVLTRRDFGGAAADLLSWRLHACSGLRVAASDVPLRSGTVVTLTLGPRPVSVTAPCRIIEVIEEPARVGFVYATLPGHPESGVERFLLSLGEDGRITLCIDGYSRPCSRAARLAPAAAGLVQAVITRRYLTALDRARNLHSPGRG